MTWMANRVSLKWIRLMTVRFVVVAIVSAAARAAVPFTPPPEHPRLLLRNGDLPQLRAKRSHPDMVASWTSILSTASQTPPPDSDWDTLSLCFASKALVGLIDEDAVMGAAAIQMAKAAFERAETEIPAGHAAYSTSQKYGRMISRGAMVYDWWYGDLTEAEKAQFVAHFKSLADKMEYGYPFNPETFGAITGHTSEGIVFNYWLSAAVAIYDEDPGMYDLVAGWIFNKAKPARDFWYASDMHHQGTDYGTISRFGPEITASWIFRRMGLNQLFSSDQLPYRHIYARRPDGQFLRDGDCYRSEYFKPWQYWYEVQSIMLGASYAHDPHLHQEFLYQKAIPSISPSALFEFLLVDPDLVPQPHSGLPLTRFFGPPMGSMIARTGWDLGVESRTVVAEMRVGGYMFNNHQHLNAGSFQLYYKGPLAIDSGIYSSTNPVAGGLQQYGKAHDKNYHKRTIAHNCMLIYDPDEVFHYANTTNGVDNDGGQRWPNKGIEARNLDVILDPANGHKVAEVLRHAMGPDASTPDFSYLKGDLTAAYSSKISDFKRSFVFLNFKDEAHPAALVVYDTVTAPNPDHRKYWLLHSIAEPVISGSNATIRSTANNYTGKLINTTLLPSAATLDKVGGDGQDFFVFGTNYDAAPVRPAGRNCEEPGKWRIEVSPSIPASTDRFLNVMQVLDDGGTPLSVEAIPHDTFAGAKIKDRVVFFHQDSTAFSGSFSFSVVDESPVLQYIVTDLAAGDWRVYHAGGHTRHRVDATGGVLCFSGEAGSYTLAQEGPSGTAVFLSGKSEDGSARGGVSLATRQLEGRGSL